MLDVTVSRSKWLRGEGSQRSFLLREEDGKMCCMGFAAIAAGLKPEDIKGKKTVNGSASTATGSVEPEDVKIPSMENWFDSLYGANDSTVIPDHMREAEIIKRGADKGIAFTFVD